MPKGHAQLRAKLLWEVTCERLRNALEPPAGAPGGSATTLAEAYLLAQEALEAVRQAFDIEVDDSSGVGTDRPQPDPAHGDSALREKDAS